MATSAPCAVKLRALWARGADSEIALEVRSLLHMMLAHESGEPFDARGIQHRPPAVGPISVKQSP